MSTHENLPTPEEAKAALDAAHATYTAVMAHQRAHCTHPTILEAPATAGMFGYHARRRICEVCGTEEEPRAGWHVLTGNARIVTRPELFQARKDGVHLYRWCWGNWFHNPHPYEGPLGYGGGSRCCADHALEAADALIRGHMDER